MAVKIYSDKTHAFYNTVEEANQAEFELKKKENLEKVRKEQEAAREKEKKEKLTAERKARAAEVDEARKAMVAAQKKYKETLEAFIKDYHSYHYTETDANTIPSLFDFFSPFSTKFIL